MTKTICELEAELSRRAAQRAVLSHVDTIGERIIVLLFARVTQRLIARLLSHAYCQSLITSRQLHELTALTERALRVEPQEPMERKE